VIFSSFKWDEQSTLDLTDASLAYVYYRHKRINLLTGFPETYSFEKLLENLEKVTLQDKVTQPHVYHFYYEFGLLLAELGHLVTEDTPLVVELVYRKAKKNPHRKTSLTSLPLKTLERPTWSEYKESFQRIQEELLAGNCYQVNLTYPFDFQTEDLIDPRDIRDYFMSRKGLGSYAHCTFLGEEMILSNSPECLFHYQAGKISTMPIKGTVKRGRNWRKDWQELLLDEKQEGELLMIVDLLKNDLNRLDRAKSKVRKLRAPLLVPGLLHQYALLELKLENKISLLKVMGGLFPGGSITGAPKRRVMEIIAGVERFQRGHYCGSTVLCWKDKKMANINIRTAQIQPAERLWRYGSGGGITLLSKAPAEFQEMEEKVKSFLTLIKAPGYNY
jgi:para-aminobenzoate synthetase component I